MRFLPILLLVVIAGACSNAQSPTLSIELGKGVSVAMALIKAGAFTQGSPTAEAGRKSDEPQREVTLTADFYMGITPVTRGQFARFVDETRFRTEAERGPSGGFGLVNGKVEQRPGFSWRNPGFPQTDDDPVVVVTCDDALAFIQWFSEKAKRPAGLPTEAQWEYAVRAGTTASRYAEPVNKVAWHKGNAGGTTHPLGKGVANAWGIRDAYGPVWQWCRDWYAPYEQGPQTNPFQHELSGSDKARRVLRGGSFLSDVSHARSAERYRNEPKSRNPDNGFRVMCSVNPSANGH